MSSSHSPDKSRPRVLLVGVDFGLPHFDAELEELGLLAQTAGLDPVAHLTCKRRAPDPALFVGSGNIVRAVGPAAVLSYLIGGLLVFLAMRMLGEMAATQVAGKTIGHFLGLADGEVTVQRGSRKPRRIELALKSGDKVPCDGIWEPVAVERSRLLGIVSVEKFCFLKRKWLKNKTR